ncbi:hypothetical protein QJS10_CPA16g01019 [Acorus calamus]|uniref:RNase H type-1 domain-containing protein n=1 Tax=Acorus calamus TaxID=4465 RepID=A0AAV9D2C5_ACOCL|nr:hypothetical protein QJS10_CPA16g01019 [Acorus calamus]
MLSTGGQAQWLRVQVQYIIFEGTTINLWEDPWLKGFGLKHHFNGQTNLHWGPPNSTPVASLIHAGKWKKPIHWPAGFDAIWEAINELEIGGCGSDILIWTGSKTGQHISSRFTEWKVSHVYREGNRVADALAAWQSEIGSTIFRPSQLNSEIRALIGEDKAGRILIRKA